MYILSSQNVNVCCKYEYLKEEGDLSPEALRMIGELLNEQSLMYTALSEMIYDQTDISDSTK